MTAFDAMIAEPTSGPGAIPAGGRFLIDSTVALAIGSKIATLQNGAGIQEIYLSEADGTLLDWIPQDTIVTLEPGCVLMLDTGLSVFRTVMS